MRVAPYPLPSVLTDGYGNKIHYLENLKSNFRISR